MGRFMFEPPQRETVAFERVTTGPNSGLAYLTQPYVISRFSVLIHPGLDIGGYPPGSIGRNGAAAWAADQNGFPAGTCNQAFIPLLRAAVERHEGLTLASNSHVGKANSIFAQLTPQALIEALFTLGTDEELLNAVEGKVNEFLALPQYQAEHSTFDTSDGPIVFGAGGNCNFDFVQTNN